MAPTILFIGIKKLIIKIKTNKNKTCLPSFKIIKVFSIFFKNCPIKH